MDDYFERWGGQKMKNKLTVKEVSEWLHVPRQRIYDLIASDILKSIKIGKRILITEESVDYMLHEYLGESLTDLNSCKKAYQKHEVTRNN